MLILLPVYSELELRVKKLEFLGKLEKYSRGPRCSQQAIAVLRAGERKPKQGD